MRGGDRRERADRRLHRSPRLGGARAAEARDARRAGPGEREGLRHVDRPRALDRRRVRRQRGGDGRARQRRGALAWQPQRDVSPLGRARRAVGAKHTPAPGRHHRLRHRRDGLHPREWGRPLAAAWRRRRARDRGHRRAAKPRRVITGEDVRAAARLLDGVAHRTPVVTSRTLGAHVVLKAECLQRAGAFKFRGAYNKIASLPAGTPVLAYSSGNHAQAVALASSLLGSRATILMPSDAPRSKVEATRGYGAEIVTYDRYTEDREDIGEDLARERGLEV